jgi:putative transposase
MMMWSRSVPAADPPAVCARRTLKAAGRLDHLKFSSSKKGTGFVQPLAAHQHWHVDISYLYVAGTNGTVEFGRARRDSIDAPGEL